MVMLWLLGLCKRLGLELAGRCVIPCSERSFNKRLPYFLAALLLQPYCFYCFIDYATKPLVLKLKLTPFYLFGFYLFGLITQQPKVTTTRDDYSVVI